jgi:hypothetical protein
MILAGQKSEVCWGEGNWIFLDIGFANNARTCGLAFGYESPRNLTYGEARDAIVALLKSRNGLMNLVIEAPLSVCFDANKNPKGRRIEKHDLQTRYWYVGPGCVVMTAAMYLISDIRELIKNSPKIEVRLFEGFVSFKKAGTDNREDVCKLRERVVNADRYQEKIYNSDQLKCIESDELSSAFRVAGLDCGIPAVIVVEPAPNIQDVQSSSATTNAIS